VALFGAGRIGAVHAASIAASDRAELAWVCDPVEPAAQALAQRYGARATSDVEAVLADGDVQGVVVASSTPTHVDLLTRSVQAGKAVLCEKPIDLDIARVEACWDAIGGSSPVVVVGFNRRFDRSFASVRTRIEAGEIGNLEQVLITSRDPRPAPIAYLEVSGGLFRDMTIHDFDMARFLAGDILEVTAVGSNLVDPAIAEIGDVDGAMVTMRAASGALVQITNSRRSSFGYDQRVEAFGSTGMLRVENQLATSVRYSGADRAEATSPYLDFFLERYATAYAAELEHFLDTVELGTPASPTFADGREALVLANAAYESVQTGRTVRVG
jgi:myo-inositol 2-dehydrogenase/D-chiro-inositol 1-dehydrogenase